jgi:hypothetical protein
LKQQQRTTTRIGLSSNGRKWFLSVLETTTKNYNEACGRDPVGAYPGEALKQQQRTTTSTVARPSMPYTSLPRNNNKELQCKICDGRPHYSNSAPLPPPGEAWA